ncbi:hypothetical protein [Streptomyces cavernae]|uniref:hypothetical protein n=1 Tax=Streptomyces cavernae TaxID=2259034 RepID=UPI000FEB8351|nr:hypothetical protein [Streptomyces cavernae]
MKALWQFCDVDPPPVYRARAATAGQLPSRSDGVGPLMLEATAQAASWKPCRSERGGPITETAVRELSEETGLADVGWFGVSLL